MTEASDPVTVALTGHLAFILLLAAVLTWPIAQGLLRLYSRAVRRSMRRQTPVPSGAAAVSPPIEGRGASDLRASLFDLPQASTLVAAHGAARLLRDLQLRPWQAALVYAVAGILYGLAMAGAYLVSAGMEVLPIRFLFLAWIFAWPVVLTVAIVAAADRGSRLAVAAGYFGALAALGSIGIRSNPDLSWFQVFLTWALYNLPATILLMTYLSRGVRAVGPLVLTFMLLALTGSDLAVSFAGSEDLYLRATVEIADVFGLGATGALLLLVAFGFVIFALLGWLALCWIRWRYQAKRLSDESVTVDAIWILFTIVHCMGLVFEHPLWIAAGVAALAAFKATVHAGFSRLGRHDAPSRRAPSLLVLRSFSIGRDGERLFDVVDRAWRRTGSIQLIAGIDLARRTVEPHEFLDFVAGKLSRRFIDGPAALEQRWQERDTEADFDRRFRVNDFFCYDDTWKMVLSRLVHESDAVLMDLRGFSKMNTGCVFELQELARLVPLDRVVFVIDRQTDEALLAETLGDCRAGVLRVASMRGREKRNLMRSLAGAATSGTSLVSTV